jgi:hypothetical protein
MRILAAMFVGRQPDGELVAVSLSTTSSAGLIGKLLAFRLEDRERAKATEKVLASEAGEHVRSLADTLGPGAAVAGILVEHTWAASLADAIERMGGAQVANEFVAGEGVELPAMLASAVSSD